MPKPVVKDRVKRFVEKECAQYTPQLHTIITHFIKLYLRTYYGKDE